MKKNIVLIILILGFFIFIPTAIKAQNDFQSIPTPKIENYGPSSGKEVADLIIKYLFSAISIAALIFLMVGGVMYITSAGNEGQTDKAKKTITYAIIGLAAGIAAYALVSFVVSYFF